MVRIRGEIIKTKIDEAIRIDRKNTRSKNVRESKAQTKLNNIYDIVRSVVRM